MTIYCDRLSFRTALTLAVGRLSGRYASETSVLVLDALAPSAGNSLVLNLLTCIGVVVSEAPFFAGHLRTESGMAVRIAAIRASHGFAYLAAQRLLERSCVLNAVNARWRKNTVLLSIARSIQPLAAQLLLRVMVAEALARAQAESATVLLHWPARLPRSLQADLPTRASIRIVGTQAAGWKTGRAASLLWTLREWLSGWRGRAVPAPQTEPTKAILLLQEDDLSLDHSYRSQPHWLAPCSTPTFRTVVIRTQRFLNVELSATEAQLSRIEFAERSDLAAARAETPVSPEIRRTLIQLGRCALLSRNQSEALAAADAARLVVTAGWLASLCVARGVRAFMTCENYLLHADAMQLIAAPMGIETISYQYSNFPYPTVQMATTADIMVAFAPTYHTRWTWPGLQPATIVDVGYHLDSSFDLVRPRATERRDRLRTAGARFIIGVFDESVQHDKYGWIHTDEYEQQLALLIDLVRRDPSVGLVYKTQFVRHIELVSERVRGLIDQAAATGRVEFPRRGHHRNTVLPAEVAASADVVIGQAAGGTASLEAALVGCRSVMLNGHGMVSESDRIYAKADIVYPSLEAALVAIDGYRRNDPSRRHLGDWSAILAEFDPFHDGHATGRLRAIIERALLGEQAPDCGGVAHRRSVPMALDA